MDPWPIMQTTVKLSQCHFLSVRPDIGHIVVCLKIPMLIPLVLPVTVVLGWRLVWGTGGKILTGENRGAGKKNPVPFFHRKSHTCGRAWIRTRTLATKCQRFILFRDHVNFKSEITTTAMRCTLMVRCEISVFQNRVDEDVSLMGCHAV
jgi:hypothetical protein